MVGESLHKNEAASSYDPLILHYVLCTCMNSGCTITVPWVTILQTSPLMYEQWLYHYCSLGENTATVSAPAGLHYQDRLSGR